MCGIKIYNLRQEIVTTPDILNKSLQKAKTAVFGVPILIGISALIDTLNNAADMHTVAIRVASALLIPIGAILFLKYGKSMRALHMFFITLQIYTVSVTALITYYEGFHSAYLIGLLLQHGYLYRVVPILSVPLLVNGAIFSVIIYISPILTSLLDYQHGYLYGTDPAVSLPIGLTHLIVLSALSVYFVWQRIDYNRALIDKAEAANREMTLSQKNEELQIMLTSMAAQIPGDLQDKWESLLINTMDAVLITDNDGIIVSANDEACKLYQFPRENLIGTQYSLFAADKERNFHYIRSLALKDKCQICEVTHYNRYGQKLLLEIIAQPVITNSSNIYFQIIERDLTEKKRMEAEMTHSKRMEALGVLASGLAHDFNNALSTIFTFIDMIIERSGDTELREQAGTIEMTTRHATMLVSNLLNFGKQTHIKENIDINDEIRKLLSMLSVIAGKKKVIIEQHFDSDVRLYYCDQSQISQIVMNLVMNAIDATDSQGRVSISTMMGRVEHGERAPHPRLHPGEYLVITVSDTGCGMTDDVKDKIFDPFFTTKADGKGLGLSMVYGIVMKDYDGVINVASQVNFGTTIDIYLPVATVDQESPQLTCKCDHKKTALVVDNDPHMLELIKVYLELAGFSVIISSSALEAANILLTNREIGLLITDIVMPLVTGEDLIIGLRKQRSDIIIIVVTVLAEEELKESTISYANAILHKPIDFDEMTRKIEELTRELQSA